MRGPSEKRVLVAAGDRSLTRFVTESLLGRKITRSNPSMRSPAWDVCRAHSALEVRLLLTKSGRHFDVIVVDQHLPSSDLISLLADLRDIPAAADVPVFVIGERGRDLLARRLASERYQITGFIEKPLSQDSLREAFAALDRARRVLVVDPHPDRARVTKIALEEAGYAVDWLTGARAALEHLERHAGSKERPDAVVSSLRLGDSDGSALCVAIKRNPETHTIPVMLFGSIQDLAKVEITENAHRADDFLREPFDASALAERLAALAGKSVRRPSEDAKPPGSITMPDTVREMDVVPPDWSDDDDGSTSLQERPVSTVHEEPPAAFVPPPSYTADARAPETKRATRRVPCRVHVRFHHGETIHRSETLNISNGGIMITTDHALEVGLKIELSFALPESQRTISAVGKVAWFSRMSESGGAAYVAGVRFSKIDPGDLKAIVDYVNSVANVVYVAP